MKLTSKEATALGQIYQNLMEAFSCLESIRPGGGFKEAVSDEDPFWCSHIRYSRHAYKGSWVLSTNTSYYCVVDPDWSICPVCGVKKPVDD